jgi:hypothetical protein
MENDAGPVDIGLKTRTTMPIKSGAHPLNDLVNARYSLQFAKCGQFAANDSHNHRARQIDGADCVEDFGDGGDGPL